MHAKVATNAANGTRARPTIPLQAKSRLGSALMGAGWNRGPAASNPKNRAQAWESFLAALRGQRRRVTLGLGTGAATVPAMSPDGRRAAWGSASGRVLVADIEAVWDRFAGLGLQR
jgi:hypothetical protein